MLFVPPSGFLWSADNITANYHDTSSGVQITAGSPAHTKGTDTEILAASAVINDVYGMAIGFCGGNNTASIRQYLVDIKYDPVGASSWLTLIPNLIVNSPSLDRGGYWYYFPLAVKAGASFAASAQCSTQSANIRVMIILYGKPSHPESVKTGSFVRAFGVNTAGSNGTSITPGSAQKSAAVSMGTTADDLWWWQAGLAISDSSQSECAYAIDVLVGDSAVQIVPAARDIWMVNGNTNERTGKSAAGLFPPMYPIKSGATVYLSAAACSAPDSSVTGAAYGLGG